ncbi:MAG: phage infection protein [Methylovirgula sp.]
MDRVKLDLENCYGIKNLNKELDFYKTRAYAIYAPNGVMKSSLAQTFQDAAAKKASSDRIFPTRKTSRKITDEKGADIDGERVLVVLPYNDQFGPNEKTSTLLVNAELREELSALLAAVNAAKLALLKAIREQSTSKRDFGAEISTAFTSGDTLEIALTRIKTEVHEQKEVLFANVEYDKIFDEKVLKALDSKDLKGAIETYIRRYNELLDASTYFKKGTFDYYNAGHIAKTLADNGFFAADHTVNLKGGGDVLEIATQKELEAVIAKEKDGILKDKDLRKTFDAISKQLEKNAEVREFYRYLQDNEALLSRMDNLSKFKEDILKSYIKVHEQLYDDWIAKYEAAKKRREEIEEEARKQRTQWERVIEIFNDRFVVPFKLEAKNREAVVLGYAPTIELAFTYIDGTETAEIKRTDLLNVLSTGEKKALYVLNVIFEIQRRMKDKQETLIVIDDLADSFDYQNKYAIVQYLKDMSEVGLFKMIVMTHNFDFFRTIQSRFVGYSNCLMASKNDTGVTLVQAAGIQNIFVNDWKKEFFTDSKKKIASICFLRNLVEMTTGETDPDYQAMTSMLHIKADSSTITVGRLDDVYNSLCKTTGASPNAAMLISDLITQEAAGCLTAGAGLNLENKIVLAIAIRLAAERFAIDKIADPAFLANIPSNQTQALISEYKKRFPTEDNSIKILDKVAVMTPENIHVNAFMYEPIVDMSDDHLRKLYTDVLKL